MVPARWRVSLVIATLAVVVAGWLMWGNDLSPRRGRWLLLLAGWALAVASGARVLRAVDLRTGDVDRGKLLRRGLGLGALSGVALVPVLLLAVSLIPDYGAPESAEDAGALVLFGSLLFAPFAALYGARRSASSCLGATRGRPTSRCARTSGASRTPRARTSRRIVARGTRWRRGWCASSCATTWRRSACRGPRRRQPTRSAA